jgi:hypothetical protein
VLKAALVGGGFEATAAEGIVHKLVHRSGSPAVALAAASVRDGLQATTMAAG